MVDASTLLAEPLYPPNPNIANIALDWSTHRRHALGSDNWQLTWADDDHQYGAWGDGGGFSAAAGGRVGLGFGRIEGGWDNCKGVDVWGGKGSENPAQFSGKSWGTTCIDGVLCSWIVPDDPDTGGPRDPLAPAAPSHLRQRNDAPVVRHARRCGPAVDVQH